MSLNFRGNLTKRKKTSYCIIHHAKAKIASSQDIHRWHLDRGWIGAGYHYYIRKDGSVSIMRPHDMVGAHALNYNHDSIAVCLEGDFEVEMLGEQQKKSLINTLSDIKKAYPQVIFKGHSDINDTKCPGKNIDIYSIIAEMHNEKQVTKEEFNELEKKLDKLINVLQQRKIIK